MFGIHKGAKPRLANEGLAGQTGPHLGFAPQQAPEGGIVRGKGGPTSDAVPLSVAGKHIHTSPKEAILPPKTVEALGGPAAVEALIERTNGKPPVKGGLREGGAYATGTVPPFDPKAYFNEVKADSQALSDAGRPVAAAANYARGFLGGVVGAADNTYDKTVAPIVGGFKDAVSGLSGSAAADLSKPTPPAPPSAPTQTPAAPAPQTPSPTLAAPASQGSSVPLSAAAQAAPAKTPDQLQNDFSDRMTRAGAGSPDSSIAQSGNSGLDALKNPATLGQYNALQQAKGTGVTASRDANGRMVFSDAAPPSPAPQLGAPGAVKPSGVNDYGSPVSVDKAVQQAAQTTSPAAPATGQPLSAAASNGIDLAGANARLAATLGAPSSTTETSGARGGIISNPANASNALLDKWETQRQIANGNYRGGQVLAQMAQAGDMNKLAQQNADTTAHHLENGDATARLNANQQGLYQQGQLGIQRGQLGVSQQNANTQALQAGFQSQAARSQAESQAVVTGLQKRLAAAAPGSDEADQIARTLQQVQGKTPDDYQVVMQKQYNDMGQVIGETPVQVSKRVAQQQPQSTPAGSPTAAHIQFLQQNKNNPQAIAAFNQHFGKDAAQKYLN